MKRIIIKLFMMILIVQRGQVFSQTNTNLGTYAGNSGTSNTSIGYEANNVVTGHSNTSVGGEVGDTLSDSFHVTYVLDTESRPFFSLTVDNSDKLPESDETNNTKVISTQPDLVVSDLKITNITSDMVSYSFKIVNIGDVPADLDGTSEATADDVNVQAYFLENSDGTGASDGGGGKIITSGQSVLEPRDTLSDSFHVTYMLNTESRPFFSLTVDNYNKLAESDETNNTKVISTRPDLVVSDLRITNITSDMVSYSFKIVNIGDVPADLDGTSEATADDVNVQAYFLENSDGTGASDGGGGKIITSGQSVLEPGDTLSDSFHVTYMLNTESRPFFSLTVDNYNKLAESEETNNTLIISTLPDVIVSELKVTNIDEDILEYDYRITNIGHAPINLDGTTEEANDNISIQAYLLADSLGGGAGRPAGGTIIGQSPLGFLAPGASFSGSHHSFITPESPLFPFLELNVDPFNHFSESNATNNSMVVRTGGIIHVDTDPPGFAGITGAGGYLYGDTCILTVVPDPGYGLVNWTENDSEVNEETIFSFVVTENRNFVAHLTELPNAAPQLQDTTFSIDEQLATGTIVGMLQAVDPEGDELLFTILSGNESGAFALAGSTGELRIFDADLLEFDTHPIFQLTIVISDGLLTDTAVVTIQLVEIILGMPDELKSGMVIYPNPASDVIHIIWADYRNASLVDLSGREVLSSTRRTMNVSALPAGTYILLLEGRHQLLKSVVIKE